MDYFISNFYKLPEGGTVSIHKKKKKKKKSPLQKNLKNNNKREELNKLPEVILIG